MSQQITEVNTEYLTTAQRRNAPLVIVHTGDGKGKTTAAMGIALRTWAAGGSIGVFQFVKSGKWRSGEVQAFQVLSEQGPGRVEWESLGKGWSWLRSRHSEEEKAQAAQEGWRYIAEGIAAEKHQLWLLDEFTYPMAWGWVDAQQVAETLRARPGRQHVIITGRRCPQPILDVADLITEMTKIRHPFDAGQRGQRGVEW